MDYGTALRKRRAELGLRQRYVAKEAGIAEDYLSQIERGIRAPSSELLEKLARILRVPVAYLQLEAEPVNPNLSPETRAAVEDAKKVAAELLRRIDLLQREQDPHA